MKQGGNNPFITEAADGGPEAELLDICQGGFAAGSGGLVADYLRIDVRGLGLFAHLFTFSTAKHVCANGKRLGSDGTGAGQNSSRRKETPLRERLKPKGVV